MKSLQIPRRFTRSAWGGTETVVLETSRRLNALGHEAKVVCPNALDPVQHEVMDGVDVTRLPYFYPYFGLSAAARSQMDRKGGNLFSPRLLAHLLHEPGVDVLHAHTGKRLGGIVRTAARLRGIPYVVSLHGGAYDVSGGEAASWTAPAQGAFEWGRALGLLVGARRVLSDAAAVICLGEEERRRVEAAHPETRAVILPNGVDPARFRTGEGAALRARLGITPDDEFVLVAGRIDPQKNQALALEVLSALKDTRPRLRLGLMGPVTSPDYLADLKQRAQRLGVADRVRIFESAPGSTDLVDAYHAADVVLVPSAHEPFGIVVLEAWASKKPVLASSVGGLVDLITPGEDGLVFAPADVRGFAGALTVLLESPERASALAAAGHQKALARYTWDAVTGQLVDLYAEVREAAAAKTPRVVAPLSRKAEPVAVQPVHRA
jgi:glycosyltransferase involved in cell wall biosynthesis